MSEEFGRRGVKQWTARHFAAPCGTNPACLHQHVERALGDLNAANRLDLCASRRLVIGDDRQGLDARPAELARLLAVAAEQMRHVPSRLKVPAVATPDQFDTPPREVGLYL